MLRCCLSRVSLAVAQAGVERKCNEEREAAEAARQARLRGPAGQLADVLLGRGWRIGRPQFRIGG